MSRPLTAAEKRRVTLGGAWCERCQVVHPVSSARGAVAGNCQECLASTTDIHLVTVLAKVRGEQAIALLLLCSVCARRGVTLDLAKEFGAPLADIEFLQARA